MALISHLFMRKLTHSSSHILPARIGGESMLHLCLDYWKIPLFRGLHGLGLPVFSSTGKVCAGNHFYEEVRIRKTAVFRALSSQAFVNEKPIVEEVSKEPLSEPLPYNLYRRISRLGDPKHSAVTALEQWIREGRRPKKWQLKRIVKELRKYNRYKHALEISEWIRGHKGFSFSPGDHSIHLDLIAKVHGIDNAETYFAELPDIAKNQLTYSALLNCYVKEKLTEKSEAIMEKMKVLGFAANTLPYNEMMTLYKNTGQLEKVLLVIQEMKKNGIPRDTFSYNIWMTTCAAMSDMDKLEDVLDEMKYDDNVKTDWTIYSNLASIYIKAGLLDDAGSALTELENSMTQNDRVPYDHLISLHAHLGNKEEMYRIWTSFKSVFGKMTNRSYICLLSSLVKIGDIEGAEKVFEEWESVRSNYDIRLPNVLLGAYIRNGWLEKAESFLERIVEKGGEPNSNTWEIFAEGYIENKQINQAAEVMKKALSVVLLTPWKPKSANVLAILKHFQEQGDVESAEEYFATLREANYVNTEMYNSLLQMYLQVGKPAPRISELMKRDNVEPDEETDMLLKQACES
eukprot:Gb_14212 [translate_table: standard]